jgi:hypothetical protein
VVVCGDWGASDQIEGSCAHLGQGTEGIVAGVGVLGLPGKSTRPWEWAPPAANRVGREAKNEDEKCSEQWCHHVRTGARFKDVTLQPSLAATEQLILAGCRSVAAPVARSRGLHLHFSSSQGSLHLQKGRTQAWVHQAIHIVHPSTTHPQPPSIPHPITLSTLIHTNPHQSIHPLIHSITTHNSHTNTNTTPNRQSNQSRSHSRGHVVRCCLLFLLAFVFLVFLACLRSCLLSSTASRPSTDVELYTHMSSTLFPHRLSPPSSSTPPPSPSHLPLLYVTRPHQTTPRGSAQIKTPPPPQSPSPRPPQSFP